MPGHPRRQQTDEEKLLASLLVKTAGGDRLAFERLYVLTVPKLTAIIRPMVRDEADVFDILQQSYLAIWQKAGSFDPAKGKAFTWMLVVSRNKALDLIRKRSRRGQTVELSETLPDETQNSEGQAASSLLRRLLLPHLTSLPAPKREAVILSVVYGMSSREIGERVGVPTNTAKSWVRRGLARLREGIDAETVEALI